MQQLCSSIHLYVQLKEFKVPDTVINFNTTNIISIKPAEDKIPPLTT